MNINFVLYICYKRIKSKMKNWFKYLFIFSLLEFYSSVISAQAPVNYIVEIVELDMSGSGSCDDGQGAEEEPTWKVWSNDNVNSSWDGGYCHTDDANFTSASTPAHVPQNNLTVSSRNNTSANQINIKFEAWEDDCGSRCSYSSSCGFLQGDDNYQFVSPIGSISFRNQPPCNWTQYSYSAGCFSFIIRIKWEFSDFNAGNDTSTCFNNINLNAVGNGEWSIFSGGAASFSNSTDPNSNFIGTLGNTYVLLWESPSNSSCITNNNSDTVSVTLNNIISQDVISSCGSYTWINGVTYTSSNNTATQVLTSSNGCDSTVFLNLTINNNPDPNLSSSPAATICASEGITFSASNGINYDWQIGANGVVFQSGLSNTYYTDTLSNTDTVYVTVTGSNGCSTTSFLHINVTPLPTCSISPGDTSICEGTSIVLNGTNTSTGVTYLWNDPSATTTSTLNVSDTGLYELTITDNNGCRAYDDVHISFYPETTISLGPDFSICEGGDTTLSIGSGYLSYNWSNGSAADTALLSSGFSWVEIQDLNTCSASDTIFIDSFSNNFIDLGNDSLICEDNPFNLSAGLGHSTYSWNTGAQTPEIVINSIGNYWVEVVNTNGCIDYDTITFDTLVNIFQLSADTTIYQGGSVDLTASGGSTYLWDNGNTTSTSNYAPTENTTAWVVIDYGNACYDSAYTNILIFDGLNVFIPNLFTPNGDGSNDVFKAYGYGFQENIEFKIYNRWNRVVYEANTFSALKDLGWDGNFNGEEQPDGVYIWILNATDLNGQINPKEELMKGTLLLNR